MFNGEFISTDAYVTDESYWAQPEPVDDNMHSLAGNTETYRDKRFFIQTQFPDTVLYVTTGHTFGYISHHKNGIVLTT